MKIKLKINYLIGVLIFQSVLLGCTNDPNKNKNNTEPNLTEFEDESKWVDEKVFYRFPSPEEVFNYIKSSDLQFNNGSLNNAASYKNYIGLKKQAINLGVYISDLSYITMFEQHETTLEYYMAIHNLSEELKISGAYSEPLVNRISNNMGNSDSLVVIASDAYNSIVDYLLAREQEDILAYISAGALIESLYLTLEYVDVFDKENELIQKTLNQKYMIANLTAYVRQQQKDEAINEELSKLNSLFVNLESIDSETTLKKTESKKLIIGGGSKLSISAENYVILKETIKNLRENFINIK